MIIKRIIKLKPFFFNYTKNRFQNYGYMFQDIKEIKIMNYFEELLNLDIFIENR